MGHDPWNVSQPNVPVISAHAQEVHSATHTLYPTFKGTHMRLGYSQVSCTWELSHVGPVYQCEARQRNTGLTGTTSGNIQSHSHKHTNNIPHYIINSRVK